MKTKDEKYLSLLEKINDEFGDWLEVGYSLEMYLLSKLHIEREKNYDLQMQIDYLKRKDRS